MLRTRSATGPPASSRRWAGSRSRRGRVSATPPVNRRAVTPEGIDALLDLWPIAEAFERLYLGPALLLDAEKNG